MHNKQHNEPLSYVIEEAPCFLKYEAPAREFLLSPWLTTQSLNMIYAWRGVGKTHMALAIAHSVATANQFLGWKLARACKVFYIDGEMPINSLQERLGRYDDITPINENLIIFSADRQKQPMPDLATLEGQQMIDRLTPADTKLIIIDNLSCLASNDVEHEADYLYQIYQKRWRIEVYHKSIKENASLAKSPTKKMRSQANHIFASIVAFCKLEAMKVVTSTNHFAIKYKLLVTANMAAMTELVNLRKNNGFA